MDTVAGRAGARKTGLASERDFSDHGPMIVAIDVGTSSARAGVYDGAGKSVEGRFHQERYEPTTTPDGGVEHDPRRLLDAVVACLDAVLVGPRRPDVLGVGVATFWHGLLGFDGGGRPVTPVYMWADTRAAADAALLRDALDDEALHARTGCHVHSSYWAAKLRWLARERPAEVRRVSRWGSFGEHLEITLFGDAATSVSMASATGLFDQRGLGWDPEALAAAGLEERQLFPLRDGTEGRRGLRGSWARRWPPLARATWFPAVGDGAAGTIGSDCTDADRVALNLGTSAALRVITGVALAPPRGLWTYRVDRRRPITGGATSEGGNVATWLRRVLHLPGDEAIEGALRELRPDTHGLTVLPFLAGERSPGWRGDRRATISGLSLTTTAMDIFCAGLEAVALRLAAVYALLAPLAADGHTIVASGGALTRSRGWTQIIADAIGRPIVCSHQDEATSRGAALLALEALGLLPDIRAARAPLGGTVEPDPARHARYAEALERQRRLGERV
jgi:gluconokinase